MKYPFLHCTASRYAFCQPASAGPCWACSTEDAVSLQYNQIEASHMVKQLLTAYPLFTCLSGEGSTGVPISKDMHLLCTGLQSIL